MIGVDNRTGPWPSLTPRDIQRLQSLLANGATARQVAEVMQVTPRTIYRYRSAKVIRQRVAGYPLVFLVYPNRRPVLLDVGARR